jgi:hypothetical protein
MRRTATRPDEAALAGELADEALLTDHDARRATADGAIRALFRVAPPLAA